MIYHANIGPKGVAGDVGRPGQTGPQGLPGKFSLKLFDWNFEDNYLFKIYLFCIGTYKYVTGVDGQKGEMGSQGSRKLSILNSYKIMQLYNIGSSIINFYVQVQQDYRARWARKDIKVTFS